MVTAVSAPCYRVLDHLISEFKLYCSFLNSRCLPVLTCAHVSLRVRRSTPDLRPAFLLYTLYITITTASLIDIQRSSTVNIKTYLNEYLRTGQLSTDDGVDHEPSSAAS